MPRVSLRYSLQASQAVERSATAAAVLKNAGLDGDVLGLLAVIDGAMRLLKINQEARASLLRQVDHARETQERFDSAKRGVVRR